MTDPLDTLQQATRQRALAQQNWVSALTGAVNSGATLEAVGKAAGVSRARVSQIVGNTGRKPGRRARV